MYNRKKPTEELPHENTAIWACTKEGCKGWIRDNFAFEHVPTCGICSSTMERTMRMLPTLENTNIDMKSLAKGVQIREPDGDQKGTDR